MTHPSRIWMDILPEDKQVKLVSTFTDVNERVPPQIKGQVIGLRNVTGSQVRKTLSNASDMNFQLSPQLFHDLLETGVAGNG